MKIFRYILMILALALIIYNSTKLDFDNLLEGDSQIALIGILAASCAMILIGILNTAISISKKQKRK